METLSSWDEQAPPAAPPVRHQGAGAAEGPSRAAKAKIKPKSGAEVARRQQPRASRAAGGYDAVRNAPDGQRRGMGLGLVPQAGQGNAAQPHPAPSAAQNSPSKGGAGQSSAERRKAYNPGKYVRVSNQSSYDAELFARSLKKGSDVLPVILSKNKLLANEILSPQLAKVSPRVRISNPAPRDPGGKQSAARHKIRTVASSVHGTLQDSVDAVVLKQLGLDAFGNPTRRPVPADGTKMNKQPKRDAVFNEASQWKSEGHFMRAALSTDKQLMQSIVEDMNRRASPVKAQDGRVSHVAEKELETPLARGQQHEEHSRAAQKEWTQVYGQAPAQQDAHKKQGAAGYGAPVPSTSSEAVASRSNPAGASPGHHPPVHGVIPPGHQAFTSTFGRGDAGGREETGVGVGAGSYVQVRQSYPQAAPQPGQHQQDSYRVAQQQQQQHYAHFQYYHQQHMQRMPWGSPAHQSLPQHPLQQQHQAWHYASGSKAGPEQVMSAVKAAGEVGIGGGWQYLSGPRAHAPSTSIADAGAGAPVPQQYIGVPPPADYVAHAPAGARPMDGIDEGRIAEAGGSVSADRMSREEMAHMLAARMENSAVDFISAGLGRPGGGAPLQGGNYYGQRKLPEEPVAVGFRFGSTGAPGIGGVVVEEARRRAERDETDAGEAGWRRQAKWDGEVKGGLTTGMGHTFEDGAAEAVMSEKERKRQELKKGWEEQIALKQQQAELEKAKHSRREEAEERERRELEANWGSIPLGAVTKDGVWLGDKGGHGLRGPSTPFRKIKDAGASPTKNAVPDELLNKESQLQSRHVNPNPPQTSHSRTRRSSFAGSGDDEDRDGMEEDEEGDGEAAMGAGDAAGATTNAKKQTAHVSDGPLAEGPRPRNVVPEELLNKASKLQSHHVRAPSPPMSASVQQADTSSYQSPGTPAAQARSHKDDVQSQRISTGIGTPQNASFRQLSGLPGSPTASPPRQHSPGSRPVSIMSSSPARRAHNHRVSFGIDGQAETPPVSAGPPGANRAAFDPSEMLGHTGPQGWSSRPGSMAPDTAVGEARERHSVNTPLVGITPGATGHVGPAIKVFRRPEGEGLAGGGAWEGDASANARLNTKKLYTLTREGQQGGRQATQVGRASRARSSVETASGKAANDHQRSRRARVDEPKPLPGRKGVGRPAAGAGRRGPGAGRGRGTKPGSEEDVFDKHEPTIISASSRLIFYTGPAAQAAAPAAPRAGTGA